MNHHGDSRALRHIKNTANQRKRCQDPARREAEQVADTLDGILQERNQEEERKNK
jgi:hypothetical protein